MVNLEALRWSWRAWLSGDEPRVGPWWVPYAWTVVFATLCAIGFTIASVALGARAGANRLPVWWAWFQVNMVISLTIALTIRLLFAGSARAIGYERLRGWSKVRRSIYFSLIPIVGTSIGWPLGLLWAVGIDLRDVFSFDRPGPMIASVGLAIVITAIFIQFFSTKARQIRAENQATEARLRLLQAQIEPHFLFNTLANVVSLIDVDAPRAKAMLESFVDYLRASLTGFSSGPRTLGDEIDLVEAYLRIVKVRMEDRLRYTIAVDAELRSLALPALTLQPLVENAIVHGIEPQIDGGTLRVAAVIDSGSLVLSVEDNGAGLRPAAAGTAGDDQRRGSGTALGNIRERIRGTYGAAATLRLDAAVPHGVRARLCVPASRL